LKSDRNHHSASLPHPKGASNPVPSRGHQIVLSKAPIFSSFGVLATAPFASWRRTYSPWSLQLFGNRFLTNSFVLQVMLLEKKCEDNLLWKFDKRKLYFGGRQVKTLNGQTYCRKGENQISFIAKLSISINSN
jgi:hypothetical protein